MAASGKRGKRRVAMPLPPPVGIADTTETPAPKKKRKKIASSQPQLSSAAHQLAAIGPKTEALLSQLRLDSDRVGLFADLTDEGLVELANALQEGWPDDQAATILDAYSRIEGRPRPSASELCRWIRSHVKDAGAVLDCMSVSPPQDISIIKVLSRAGSQKLVFLATWRLRQREVVLKWVKGPKELRDGIVRRESQSHPLSMKHDNIVETHFLQNAAGEPFLVEEYLPELLNDNWQSNGLHEAANLLWDIANALNFLHGTLQLVHGDIKPDNIGKRGDNYVLLDFGIARQVDSFVGDVTATGSLRTRAPELFLTDHYDQPTKVDIWALGATLFKAVVGRFPLFDKDEPTPRVSKPAERREFEGELRRRVEEEWDKRVDFSKVPEPLRGVLRGLLELDPAARITAAQVGEEAERVLTAYLRKGSAAGRFSAIQALDQLEENLPNPAVLKLMPVAEKQRWKRRFREIGETSGLTLEDKHRLDNLTAKLA
jgi:serine/threonine protein kinase